MGLTIDMVSGEVLEESSTRLGQESSTRINENFHSNTQYSDMSEIAIGEQLISITEPEQISVTEMPESVSQVDVDLFLDKFN
jgi:hypothetical protein